MYTQSTKGGFENVHESTFYVATWQVCYWDHPYITSAYFFSFYDQTTHPMLANIELKVSKLFVLHKFIDSHQYEVTQNLIDIVLQT